MEVAYDGVVSKVEVRPEFGLYGYDENAVKVSDAETVTQKGVMDGVVTTDGVDEFVISRSSWTLPVRQDSMEFSVRVRNRLFLRGLATEKLSNPIPRLGRHWSVEAQTAGHTGKHMENDNRRPFNATSKTPEKIRHMGNLQPQPPTIRHRRRASEDEEIEYVS